MCKKIDYVFDKIHSTLSSRMTLTFLLAPPSDTLGLVLKSPSKLNIVRFFPLTDSEVDTDSWNRKRKENKFRVFIQHLLVEPKLKQVMKWNQNDLATRDLATTYTQLTQAKSILQPIQQALALADCNIYYQIKQAWKSIWTRPKVNFS